MRINEFTAVSTKRVTLVPYSAHHVPKYHEWMKDPDIQAATASEPLTLDEEYGMQRSWRVDGDKLTFIICRPVPENNSSAGTTRDGQQLDLTSMIGDVNLFISLVEDDADDDQHQLLLVGEVELMIAEKTEQGKGLGRAALLAFLRYIMLHERLILTEFQAGQRAIKDHSESTSTLENHGASSPTRFDHFAVKIGQTNHRSMALFESLGFRKTSDTPSYFGEYELRLGRAEAQRNVVSDPDARTRGLLEGYTELKYLCP
ncbi:hypothetical protein KCU88_g2436, partial [Aureobasidium melanogenum]